MAGSPVGAAGAGSAGAAGAGSAAASIPLASALAGGPVSFINADVALDGEPVVGSFTVDGLTFAVAGDGSVELVGVSSQSLAAPDAPTDLGAASAASETEAETLALVLPESVSFEGADYALTSIAPYAFYLSGVTSVELPASIDDVDDRAFRSSDVSSVEVDSSSRSFASFDGILYDADHSSLLLIPGGRTGAARISSKAEEVDAAAFSHCAGVTAISVDAGSDHLSSWDGLLYDADGTTLIRVPAGATDITIREGCTTIAAGAMEGCASLASITAPASVASISPDVFTSVPTVSLPAASVADDAEESSQAEASDSTSAQLTALVALSSTDDDLPEVDPASIQVSLPEAAVISLWSSIGFSIGLSDRAAVDAALDSALAYAACNVVTLDGNGATTPGTTVIYTDGRSNGDGWYSDSSLRNKIRQITVPSRDGYVFGGYWGYSDYDKKEMIIIGSTGYLGNGDGHILSSRTLTAIWHYTVAFDVGESGIASIPNITATLGSNVELPVPVRKNYLFLGWDTMPDGSGTRYQGSALDIPTGTDARAVLYAQWRHVDCDVGFDTSSEPGDDDYPGDIKPDQIIKGDQIEAGDKVEVGDPKRPGYVFQGWTMPNAEGTEAIDQDLVYQDETDGKWYVDASKLPDYANDEGRVELTARWTSVLSVDVPRSVTFYADIITEGQQSRDGLASSAFGQTAVQSHSQVDLRIVGLESSQIETQGDTLGADSVLRKKDGSMLSGTADKVFSLFPSSGVLSEDDLKNPDRVSEKPLDAVDFSLDDTLLEESFAADRFTIPAGKKLNLGYRLNLSETGIEIAYDRLSALSEGSSASIATVSYSFATNGHLHGIATGTTKDPFYIQYGGKVYGLNDIKGAADCISKYGTKSPCYPLYKGMLDKKSSFRLWVDKRYLDVRLIGIYQDTKTGGGKAGFTFQMKDIYAYGNKRSTAAGGGTFISQMNASGSNTGGWLSCDMRKKLRGTFMGYLDSSVQKAIVPVDKYHQLAGGTTASYLQKTTGETIWLPSIYELYGAAYAGYNSAEGVTNKPGYARFQYQAYQGNGGSATNAKAVKTYNGTAQIWWTRSAGADGSPWFCRVTAEGAKHSGSGGDGVAANGTFGAVPCFCL